MGLFAFRRMKEREAAAQAVASAPEKPKSKTSNVKPDGSNNQRNSGRRKREQLHNAG
jgi:hypothetical protein